VWCRPAGVGRCEKKNCQKRGERGAEGEEKKPWQWKRKFPHVEDTEERDRLNGCFSARPIGRKILSRGEHGKLPGPYWFGEDHRKQRGAMEVNRTDPPAARLRTRE